jgi:hypothetical protein
MLNETAPERSLFVKAKIDHLSDDITAVFWYNKAMKISKGDSISDDAG